MLTATSVAAVVATVGAELGEVGEEGLSAHVIADNSTAVAPSSRVIRHRRFQSQFIRSPPQTPQGLFLQTKPTREVTMLC